jgi:16S rRNA (uracil1498-N3)-methyltransferase
MQRFFLSTECLIKNKIIIHEVSLVHQISHVMRCKKGDKILCLFNDGFEHLMEIEQIGKKKVEGLIIKTMKNTNELPYTLTLIQALPKSKDIWENIIKKSVELGVSHIIPFTSSRTTAKYPAVSPRIQSIVREASEQSERAVLAEIVEPYTFHEVSQYIQNTLTATQVFLADSYMAKQNPLLLNALQKNKPSDSGVIIGPEGGFSEKEIESLSLLQTTSISLGSLILRVETAAISSLAIMAQYIRR